MRRSTKTGRSKEVTLAELRAIVEKTRSSVLSDEEHGKLKAGMDLLRSLITELAGKKASIKRLRKLLFGPKSETSKKILGKPEGSAESGEGEGEEPGVGAGSGGGGDTSKKKRKGHGRKSAEDYTGATIIHIPHGSLSAGAPCPDPLCAAQGGRLYRLEAKRVVRILGQAALGAIVYLLERLRCSLCGTVYTAKPPAGIGQRKYDVTAVSMMAILRYGVGVPLNRLARLQGDLGIPLAATTQWEVVREAEPLFKPVYDELIREAAQADRFHNDDTDMVVLEILKEIRALAPSGKTHDRTGIFTTGIIAVKESIRIALFFTGREHAGENLSRVLSERHSELPTPIQMCDALPRNVPQDFETVLCNCMSHARRQYVDVREDFPDECRFVIETLGGVFKNDGIARKEGMTAEERLQFHRGDSRRRMASLRLWMYRQLGERRVEPNSGLGEAIKYMKKHWKKLTRFLFVAGAPVDNNVVERALKKAITHRKNSLFYKTENGARVGDMYMSIIATCQLAGVNPLDYLNAIQRNAVLVAKDPAAWMPWNWQATMERLNPSGADPPGAQNSALRSVG